jgi:predicted permease
MHALFQDVRYAVRQLLKAPGFAGLAVLTLALGIGANAAMFTAVESVLLRALPYPNSTRLVSVRTSPGEGFTSTSWLNYRDVHDQSQTLQPVAGYSEDVGVVQGKDGSLSVVTPGVTPNLFPTLGVNKPLLGRIFTEQEGQSGGPLSVVISEGLWRQQFGADPGIIGKSIRVNAKPRTVVGVMPASFGFPESMGQDMKKGLWLPLQPTDEMLRERGYHFFVILAGMKPGVTLAQVNGELGAITNRIRQADPEHTRDLQVRGASYQELLTGPVRPVFMALMVALGLVLLIGCANVANLLIARCLWRQQEFAVRAALGASQRRLLQQLIVEGWLLSVLGCVVGFAFASLAIDLVRKLPPDTFPRAGDVAIHWTMLGILAVIATFTTVLSSLLPALLVARTDPQPALQAASRGLGSRGARSRMSGWLVACEVALSTLLLIATGLLFRTLWSLEHARLGFDVTRVTTFTAMPTDATGFSNMKVAPDAEHAPPSIANQIYQPVLERMQSMPGVEGAALVTAPPLSGIDMHSSFSVIGRPDDPEHRGHARITAVSGSYARVMGTPVVRGRMISEDDAGGKPYVIAINEKLARTYFAHEDPLGHQLELGGKDTGMLTPYTIVGIIGDYVDTGVSQPPQPLVMLPYQQVPATSIFYAALLNTVVNFAVKTRNDIAVAPAMRSAFKQVAPDFALDNFQSMQQAVDQNNFNDRLSLYLIASFAGLAVLMVVAGLYGVLAQLVNYRRREIGVRLALGATRKEILTMILRQGSMLLVAGLVVGIGLALITSRFVKSFLFGVKPIDPSTYACVVVLLLAVGTLAALVPARRAAAVEPIQALRDE